MSISRTFLRYTTIKAIVGKTMAEDRVRDSSIVDLDKTLQEAPQPIALIYTDDSSFNPTGKEVHGGQGTTTLVIILAVAGAAKLDNGEIEFVFPHTDASIEMSLDMIERQIQMALSDPDNEWAALWRELVLSVVSWKSQRGGSTKEGVRFAARQLLIEVETVRDPAIGGEPEGVWAQALGMIETTDPALVPPLRALIVGRMLPEWKRTMAELGINRVTLDKIGLGPVGPEPDGEIPIVSRIRIMPDGVDVEEATDE